MHKFKSVSKLVEAMKKDEIPVRVISPGAAAAALGVSRQAVHQMVKRGTLEAWVAEGIILIDSDQVQARAHRTAGVSPDQGGLL